MPLAPAATRLDRFPDQLAALPPVHRILAPVIAATRDARLPIESQP